MAITVQIITKGKDPINWLNEVRKEIHFEFQESLVELAHLCANRMAGILQASGYHLERLAQAMNVDILNSTAGVEIGIGKISDFPVGQESGASYWEAFDSGFKVTQANIGYFGDNFRAPEAGGFGEKWHHTGRGSGFFLMKPNKVIEPLNFIRIAGEELRMNIIKQIDKLTKEIDQAAK